MTEFNNYLILLFLFYSCSTVNRTNVKVEYILEGHSKNIINDTLITPDGYQLGELHLKLILYDYIAVDDSIHLFFQSLFASKCTDFFQLYTFENLKNNKAKDRFFSLRESDWEKIQKADAELDIRRIKSLMKKTEIETEKLFLLLILCVLLRRDFVQKVCLFCAYKVV